MYGGHINTASSNYLNHQFSTTPNINNQSLDYPARMTTDHELALGNFSSIEDVLMVMNKQQQEQHLHEVNNLSSGSLCSSSHLSSPSSLGSYNRSSSMHRTESCHSFQISGGFNPSVSSPTGVLSDTDDCSFKSLLSSADLQQGIHVPRQNYGAKTQLSSPKESSLAIVDGLLKAQRYSPEEKKERIKRYRSKRNQRNFNKKVQYACRKTLADRRPRIKGRFARTDEMDNISQTLWSHTTRGDHEDDEPFTEDYSWINLLKSFSSNLDP